MILFIISFIMVFATSYFLTCITAPIKRPEKNVLGLIYLFIIAFAQIVLTFEVLSLFAAIKEGWVLFANALFLAGSATAWVKSDMPIWKLDLSSFKNRVANSLKLDKSLMVLYVGYCVFIISAILLCVLLPVTNADAQAYHLARSLFWTFQGSLNHFVTSDIRNLCLPINSEILYSWVLLFTKKDVFIGFFGFTGYLMSMISVYSMMSLLGFCTRKKLWAIFILSSFASVLVQASGVETDIVVAGLVSSSMFLFWYALKHNKKIPVFIAALAYALAVGTKTPSIFAIPGVALFLLALCIYYKRFKQLAWFVGFGLINFIIFSSFNYIQNFIHFGNPIGSESFMVVSGNYFGVKGLWANFIKYIYLFLDFTGFRWSEHFADTIIGIKELSLALFGLAGMPDGLYTEAFKLNKGLFEPLMGAGILGFLVYIPYLIISLLKPIFKFKRKKVKFIFAFALLFIINMITLSYVIAYMAYNVRFIMFFMILSAPILVYSYKKRMNPYKFIVIIFALYYLIGVSTHIWPRPLVKILKVLNIERSISKLRYRASCRDFEKNPLYANATCIVANKIRAAYKPGTKILIFINSGEPVYLYKVLEFEGYHVDFGTLETAEKINFDNYNLIITTNKGQTATYIQDFENRKDSYEIIKGKIILKKPYLVPCVYIENPILTARKGRGNSYPFQVRCGFSHEFLVRNRFKKVASIGAYNPDLTEQEYFIIYENKPVDKLNSRMVE